MKKIDILASVWYQINTIVRCLWFIKSVYSHWFHLIPDFYLDLWNAGDKFLTVASKLILLFQ